MLLDIKFQNDSKAVGDNLRFVEILNITFICVADISNAHVEWMYFYVA